MKEKMMMRMFQEVRPTVTSATPPPSSHGVLAVTNLSLTELLKPSTPSGMSRALCAR